MEIEKRSGYKTQRENRLKTIHFEHPEYIPVNFVVNENIRALMDALEKYMFCWV